MPEPIRAVFSSFQPPFGSHDVSNVVRSHVHDQCSTLNVPRTFLVNKSMYIFPPIQRTYLIPNVFSALCQLLIPNFTPASLSVKAEALVWELIRHACGSLTCRPWSNTFNGAMTRLRALSAVNSQGMYFYPCTRPTTHQVRILSAFVYRTLVLT